MMPLLSQLRPHQWLKNGFVFLGLLFGHAWNDPVRLGQALAAFAAFCLLASAVYVMNDLIDREQDRLHPNKRLRPLAAGTLGVAAAAWLAAACLVAGGLVAWLLAGSAPWIFFAYVALNVGYSFGLKHVVILDVFIIASGFMLRVIGGAEVIEVMISQWIVLCTMFLSLFLATAKRRGEIVLFQSVHADSERKVLQHYDLHFLDSTMMITASGMAISYALYTVADRTVKVFGTEYLIFTTIFVLFGIFRYLFLVFKKNMGENSVAIILKDLPMFVNLCLWFLSCVLIIYRF